MERITLRCYEMFLGPLEQAKPWDVKGIEGVHRFLKKFWRLFFKDDAFAVSDEEASPEELKILHQCIKRVNEDIERFAFNTVVSELMICVNGLTDLNCNKRSVLSPLTVLLSPYAPFIAEELWELLGNKGGISYAEYPGHNEQYLVENTHKIPGIL